MKIDIPYFNGMVPIQPNPRPINATYCLDAEFDGGMLTPIRTNRKVSSRLEVGALYEARCGMLYSKHCESFAEGGLEKDARVHRAGYDGVWTAYETDALQGKWKTLGFPGVMPAPLASAADVVDDETANPTAVAYCYVNGYGEMSMPSEPSPIMLANFDSTILVSGIPVPPPELGVTEIVIAAMRTGFENGSEKKNLANTALFEYARIKPGVTAASFRFGIPGDMILTMDYAPPPQRMVDLSSWRNGQLSGIADHCLWFSVPNHPHAWPEAYRMRVYGQLVRHVVGIQHGYVLTDEAPFVVRLQATQGNPYFHNGDHVAEPLPCVSRKSAAIYGDSVIYASNNSLVMLTGFTTRVLKVWPQREWASLKPDQMRGAVSNGYYYGFGDDIAFRIKLTQGEDAGLTYLSDRAAEVHASRFGRLFLATLNGVEQFADGEDFRTAVWEHDQVLAPKTSLGAFRLEGSGTVQLLSDRGKSGIATAIGPTRGKIQRVRGSRFGVRVTTNSFINSVTIASELAQV